MIFPDGAENSQACGVQSERSPENLARMSRGGAFFLVARRLF